VFRIITSKYFNLCPDCKASGENHAKRKKGRRETSHQTAPFDLSLHRNGIFRCIEIFLSLEFLHVLEFEHVHRQKARCDLDQSSLEPGNETCLKQTFKLHSLLNGRFRS
jgi:hypothetical protein